MASLDFDPNNVNLICFLSLGRNEYNGNLGVRISSVIVTLFVSWAAILMPVLWAQSDRFKVPNYVYLFGRYFGAGVIVSTAFIQWVPPFRLHAANSSSLMDPAYGEIGPNTCVGMTGGWAGYSWPPAIILVSVVAMFLLDFAAVRYVEIKYGISHAGHTHGPIVPTDKPQATQDVEEMGKEVEERSKNVTLQPSETAMDEVSAKADRSFKQQIAAFLILEFGIIFHSVIIGLNLGTAGKEFAVLYPVIVFHQAFEGFGVGARMSAIPFPKRIAWLPWALCASYGLTTPLAISIGIGLRSSYNGQSYQANIISGVFDSTSAGILIYTGLVELLARDFLFNPERTTDNRELTLMIVSTIVGAAAMAVLGKWA
jgi:solute carrier family 39 (zinc transporter), member 1/2/3